MWWYDFGIRCYTGAIKLVSPFNRKAKLWKDGRKGIFDRLEEAMRGVDKPVVWVHSASLGEFEQGRPVMEEIKRRYPDYKILLTFFSPSGYEIRKNYDKADWVFYLPADTAKNAEKFLRIVNPRIAIFVKYEFWLNYLERLRIRNIRTFIVSAIFRQDSVFFKSYGKRFRNGLAAFERLFVQDDDSRALLETIGLRENVVVAGDTRFDRVADIAHASRELPEIERFVDGKPVFVAGSTWGADEQLLEALINNNPDVKFIVAPHEMNDERIDSLIGNTKGGGLRYTKYVVEGMDTKSYQLLVIDTIGILSSVYRYADYAYIGGGFGTGIHNTLEAVTYGLPVAFGPNYHKFREARELLALGVAACVRNDAQLNEWFTALKTNAPRYDHKKQAALKYIADHTGATKLIVDMIFDAG